MRAPVCLCLYAYVCMDHQFLWLELLKKSQTSKEAFQKTISSNVPNFGLLASQPSSVPVPNSTEIEV